MVKGHAVRRSHRIERGAVYVEAILCLIPLLALFFGVVQLALVAQARLVVRHAAAQGARAAVVLLEDDPSCLGNAPRGEHALHPLRFMRAVRRGADACV